MDESFDESQADLYQQILKWINHVVVNKRIPDELPTAISKEISCGITGDFILREHFAAISEIVSK